MGSLGWVSIHRKIREHWVWTNDAYFKAWIAILMEVNHTPTKVLIKGKLIECGRGQSLNSLSTWGTIFGNWSTKRVRTFLKNLEKDQMVGMESVTVTTRLTVCNYDEYQDKWHAKGTQKARTGHARGTHEARTGITNNNVNNAKNENKEEQGAPKRTNGARVDYPDDFQELWEMYPPRGGSRSSKKDALTEYKKAKKKVSHETIKDAIIVFSQSEKAKSGYAKDMFRWLRTDPWDDDMAISTSEQDSGFDIV